MCCRIDRILTDENVVVLTITGRIREDHVETLRGLLEQEVVPPALDLQHVMLVDREAVKYLALIEANGCDLEIVRSMSVNGSRGQGGKHCAAYRRKFQETSKMLDANRNSEPNDHGEMAKRPRAVAGKSGSRMNQ
jgi:hypothetical protein